MNRTDYQQCNKADKAPFSNTQRQQGPVDLCAFPGTGKNYFYCVCQRQYVQHIFQTGATFRYFIGGQVLQPDLSSGDAGADECCDGYKTTVDSEPGRCRGMDKANNRNNEDRYKGESLQDAQWAGLKPINELQVVTEAQ